MKCTWKTAILVFATVSVCCFGQSGCKKSGVETKQATTAKGGGYSVPVPNGYEVVTDKRFNPSPGGVVLKAKNKVSNDAFIGSIAITPVPSKDKLDPANLEACATIAKQMEQSAPVKLQGHKLATTSLGKNCQWDLRDNKQATRAARGTLMCKAGSNCWVVTCNYDTRDEAAPIACQKVLAGWKYE